MRNASIAALIFFLTIAAKPCSADLCPSCYAWQQAWFQALVDLNVALDDQEELLAYWQSEIVRILQTPPEKWDESVVYLLNQAQQGVLDAQAEIQRLQDLIAEVDAFYSLLLAACEICNG